MRVARNYYCDKEYHRADVVDRLVNWCNNYMRECGAKGDVFAKRLAHQLKCLVIKRYSRTTGPAFIPLCAEWEEYPMGAIQFLWDRKMREPRRIDIKKDAKEISPETII